MVSMVSHVGGIYLKNMIAQYWKDREATELIDGVAPFVIAEQDKATIREHIVEAVIHAPELIRYRLNILGPRPEVVRPVLTCNTSITTCIKKAYVLVRMARHKITNIKTLHSSEVFAYVAVMSSGNMVSIYLC